MNPKVQSHIHESLPLDPIHVYSAFTDKPES
jgi:hypothetical protein